MAGPDPDRRPVAPEPAPSTVGRTQRPGMGTERDRLCPSCGEVRSFRRAASTRLALGPKVKWHCPECEYGFVTIGDAVDTGPRD